MTEENCTTATNCAGFTIIELVIVIVIAGIMMTVAIPYFRKSTDRGGVNGAADAIASIHSRAKLTAIQRGRITRLHIRPSLATIWVVASKSSGTGLDTVGKVENLGSRFGVTLTSSADSLIFTPRGIGAEVSATTIIVTKGTAADTLTISAAGRVVH